MLYSRLKFTLIICILQMCSFRATGPFEHLANAGPDSVRSIAWESNHRPRTGQSSGETSENLKRTWKDTLVTDSDPSPLESCHVENTMSKKNKQTSVETDMVEITKRRYMTMLDKFDIWESSVSTLKLPDAELSRVELQMQEIRNAVRNLFDKKIYELIGEPYQFQATEALVTGDLAAGVMERWEGMWLNSVANIHKTWEFPDQLKNSLESIQFSRQGIDFLIDFFIELQTLEVITQKRLKDFLNNKDGSRIISSYIYNRFHKPRLDVCKLYLNFNVKLSLLEGPATRKMADLLEG
ncbi:hypothetical protein PtB15_15B111 [Puccinia triticina]|nr:hypothetical protein PtB15_15B111 [Puccinia triticina]